jgi:hypothetical protein
MGSRNVCCVVVDGEFRVAQYAQWGAEPGSHGLVLLRFLRDKVDDGTLEEFTTKVKSLKTLTEDEVEDRWVKAGAERGVDAVSFEVADRVRETFPSLSRETGASIMRMIDSGQVTEVRLSHQFATDSLMCEWAYVIDLDTRAFEVFQGFQEAPHQMGRFADWEVEDRKKNRYWPVAEVARFNIDNLPDDETFVQICNGSILDRLANLEHEAK